MARPTTSSATNSENNMEALRFQRLLRFDPNGVREEVYDPKSFCALLNKHLKDHSKKAKPSRRNSDAGESGAQSHPCDGNAFEAAKVDMGEEGRT